MRGHALVGRPLWRGGASLVPDSTGPGPLRGDRTRREHPAASSGIPCRAHAHARARAGPRRRPARPAGPGVLRAVPPGGLMGDGRLRRLVQGQPGVGPPPLADRGPPVMVARRGVGPGEPAPSPPAPRRPRAKRPGSCGAETGPRHPAGHPDGRRGRGPEALGPLPPDPVVGGAPHPGRQRVPPASAPRPARARGPAPRAPPARTSG